MNFKQTFAISLSVISLLSLTPLAQAQSNSIQEEYTKTETYTTTNARPLAVPVFIENGVHPPYQAAWDMPVQLSFYTPGADQVDVSVKNLRTGAIHNYELGKTRSGLWTGQIPTRVFEKGDTLAITYNTNTSVNENVVSDSRNIQYMTLNTPDFYHEAMVDNNNARLLIVPFQDKAANSPSFNVYWPELFYAKKPLAARVNASRSPENSVRKLDPIRNRPGWFQFQVPSLWFSPGEEITVDFSTEYAQRFNSDSDYPVDSNQQFIPVESVRFATLTTP